MGLAKLITGITLVKLGYPPEWLPEWAKYHYRRATARGWWILAKVIRSTGNINASNTLCMAYMNMHPDYSPATAKGDALANWAYYLGLPTGKTESETQRLIVDRLANPSGKEK